MKTLPFILMAFFLSVTVQLSSQSICDPPCTTDPTCVDVENPGEVCPEDLPLATQYELYDETVTIIPPNTYQGFPIISKIRVVEVNGLPEGISWCKSSEDFVVGQSHCCQLTGTPTTPGEYPLSLVITAFIGPVAGGTVTDDTSLMIIVLPPAPVAAFTANPTIATAGTPITFTDQSTNNPTSWNWTFQGGTPLTSTDQNPTVTYATQGVYDVTLIVANDGGSDELSKPDYITIDNGTSVSESMYQKVKIYPNPASRQITIEAEGLISVSVLDMLGKVVLSLNANSSKETIDISSLGKANYFVKISTVEGKITKSITIK